MEGIKKSKDSFATSFTVPSTHLSVEIKDVGVLKFPISSRGKAALLNVARPAKYGKNEKTLHDPSVRRTWEIPKSKIKIDSRAHREFFRSLLKKVAGGLGLGEETELRAELHNLLVYEEGDFFKPHQDSEKGPGMIGTLTLALPSTHTGGGFHVHHRGQEKRFYSSRLGDNSLQCIAFYADCIHEVRPVTSGFRIALTFNIFANSASKPSPAPREVREFISAITGHLEGDNGRELGLYLLDHQYTEASFGWDVLKRSDGRVARALFAAAEEVGLEAYIVLAEIHECWSASCDYGDYRWYRYQSQSEPTPEELFDLEISISAFRNRQGKRSISETLAIDSKLVINSLDNSDLTPVEQEYEGYMGNYGNTLEYWYRRAGVVFWKKGTRLVLLLKQAPEVGAMELVKRAEKGEEIDEYLRAALKGKNNPFDRFKDDLLLIQLCSAVNDRSIVSRILERHVLELLGSKAMSGVISLLGKFGSPWLEELVNVAIDELGWRDVEVTNRLTSVVRRLTAAGGDAVSKRLLRLSLDRYLKELKQAAGESCRVRAREYKKRQKRFTELVGSITLLSAEGEWGELFGHLEPDLLDAAFVRGVVLPHSETLTDSMRDVWRTWEDAALTWVREELAKLQGVLGSWRLPVRPSCSCVLCGRLTTFLQSDSEELVWPLKQMDREHVSGAVEGLAVGISLRTVAQGSPHKLILTKSEVGKLVLEERYHRYTTLLTEAREKEVAHLVLDELFL